MSDERLHQLGIPRRRFLKGTAAAAFVSPLVVSFGLDGSAEALPGGPMPNQFCANQTISNQFYELDHDLTMIIYWALIGLRGCDIDRGLANRIAHQAFDLAMRAAGGPPSPPSGPGSVCGQLSNLVTEIETLPASQVKSELLGYAHQAQYAAGCVI
jgi:hypothetical protein